MVDLPTIAEPVAPMTPSERRRAFMSRWFKDHGFLRDLYCNIRKVDDQMWRAAQVGPSHLRWAKAQGIKSILNLRGRRDNCGAYTTEREEAHKLGLTLVDFPIRSRSAIEVPTLKAALGIFETLEYPCLMHCKSGADRTGFFSTLYLYHHRGVPLEQAMEQLSWKYGHFKQAKTGVIDFFYDSFAKAHVETGISLTDWAESAYDPQKLDREFRQNWAAAILVDKILRRE